MMVESKILIIVAAIALVALVVDLRKIADKRECEVSGGVMVNDVCVGKNSVIIPWKKP